MLINNTCKNDVIVKKKISKHFIQAQEFSPWLLSDPRAVVTYDDDALACSLL